MASKSKASTVWNETRGVQVVSCLEHADNFFTRFKGLMGRPDLPQGHGLWITPCADIHSCFMRFLFDALFISKEGDVLHLVENMPAWRMSKWVKGSHGVLELPGGTIAQSGTQVGDRMRFQ